MKLYELLASTVLIVAIYYVTVKYFITRNDYHTQGSYNVYPNNSRVTLVKGIMPLSTTSLTLNTYDKTNSNYVYIPHPSNSENNGFTYSFWMNRGANTRSKTKDNIIFMRGLNQYNRVKHDNESKNMIVVKCPLLRFGDNDDELVLEYNSMEEINNVWVIKTDVLGIMGGDKWGMYTFVFSDYKDKNEIKRGIKIDFYLDNRLIKSHHKFEDGLKKNVGPIYILPKNEKYSGSVRSYAGGDTQLWFPPPPNDSLNSGSLSNFTYSNYALGPNDIDELFMSGFDRHSFVTPKNIRQTRMKDSYKILSLYNETKQTINE